MSGAAWTLRIIEHDDEPAGRPIELELLDDGGAPRQNGRAWIDCGPGDDEQEDLRWYLEDYPSFPEPPAPEIALRIEQKIDTTGRELFRQLFHTPATNGIWAQIQPVLPTTKIEILARRADISPIPWEFLRDPASGSPLALAARTFVYVSDPTPGRWLGKRTGSLRILLVICRPRGAADVSFRSVANRLVRAVAADPSCEIDVLRPATFERLQDVLFDAARGGWPYDVVHFDGHGIYDDLNARMLGAPANAKRGYVLFEGGAESSETYVDGASLGRVLVRAGVATLVLNACRSGAAEARPVPGVGAEAGLEWASRSLAWEVIEAGVPSAVAMRYNIYVPSAARFVEALYLALGAGASISEAVSASRRAMASARDLALFNRSLTLDHWLLPVVIERRTQGPAHDPQPPPTPTPVAPRLPVLDRALPDSPAIGFIGADECLLGLDRAFDKHRVVLLHGFAGGGKSAAACEFGRWYARTSGVTGAVLFSRFDRQTRLSTLLDQLAEALPSANDGDVQGRKADNSRRDQAIARMRDTSVLWIWDDVDELSMVQSAEERRELQASCRGFLADAAKAGARFLLTSRSTELAWLGDLPFRFYVPFLSVDDRMQLLEAVVQKRSGPLTRRLPILKRLTDPPTSLAHWWPLVRFSKGNPLVLTGLLRHALKGRLRRGVPALVQDLRDGREPFEDIGDRATSIRASLRFGLAGRFTPSELSQLAALWPFQSIIDVDVLVTMADHAKEFSVPALRGSTREHLLALLDRCADGGLLKSGGRGVYVNHPMTPTLFGALCGTEADRTAAARAFVGAIMAKSASLAAAHDSGQPFPLGLIGNEESNLLQARKLALETKWFDAVPEIMQSLRRLYDNAAAVGFWRELVTEILPVFIDTRTELPLPGMERHFHLITDFRALSARQFGRGDEERRLQQLFRDWKEGQGEQQAESLVAFLDPATRRYFLRRQDLSNLLSRAAGRRSEGDPGCVDDFKEAIAIADDMGERLGTVVAAHGLGLAHVTIPRIRNLTEAKTWSDAALAACPTADRPRLAQCHLLAGLIEHARLQEQSAGDAPPVEMQASADAGVRFLSKALGLIPAGSVVDLVETNLLLGSIHRMMSRHKPALEHLRRSLQLSQRASIRRRAAEAQLEMALTMLDAGQHDDARAYAEAAALFFASSEPEDAEKHEVAMAIVAATKVPPAPDQDETRPP